MTAEEDADELVEKMTIDWDMCRGQNIKCAIICVDEMLDMLDTSHLREMKRYLASIK